MNIIKIAVMMLGYCTGIFAFSIAHSYFKDIDLTFLSTMSIVIITWALVKLYFIKRKLKEAEEALKNGGK